MIIKNNKKNQNIFKLRNKIFNFFSYFGLIVFIIIFALSVLVFSNKLFFKHYVEIAIQKSVRILWKDQLSIQNLNDFKIFLSGALKGLITKNNYPKINLLIKQENVIKLHNSIKNNERNYIKVKLETNVNSPSLQTKLKGKVRIKGDRELHWEDYKSNSYRVKLSKNSRLNFHSDFSIHHPIIRNYTWEIFISEIADKIGILSLKTFPINFFVNGDSRGLYFIEEFPNQETLEKKNKKNGPIFSVNDLISSAGFPFLEYELYQQNYWLNNQPHLYFSALAKLENLKKIHKEKNFSNFNSIFDIESWAKYFALLDRFGAYHASVPKSAKLFYSPTIGKFEPILTDAHVGAGSFKNFLLSDFIFSDLNNVDCEWICSDEKWFKTFFSIENKHFIEAYYKYVEMFSSDEFSLILKDLYDDKIQPINNEVYSSFMRKDKVFYRGFTPFFFQYDILTKRKDLLAHSVDNYKFYKKSSEYNKVLDSNNFQDSNFDIHYFKNIYKKNNVNFKKFKNLRIQAQDINYFNSKKPTVIILEGDNILKGLSNNKPLIIDSKIMIVQLFGSLELDNVIFENLININLNEFNWSGGINIINSKFRFNNISLINITAEDSINIVNSISKGSDIYVNNSHSDAIDIDFGSFTINKIQCINIINDCLDTSGAVGSVNYLLGSNVQDKLLSSGEKSYLNINNIDASNINIGVVSKDGSETFVKNLNLKDSKYSGASFIKKPYFGPAFLEINEINNNGDFDFLLGQYNQINLPKKYKTRYFENNKEIEKMIYE